MTYTRSQLRQEIEDTRLAFHQLLASTPEEALALPSANPAWTVGQVLYHVSIAPRMLGTDVRMITGRQWIYRLVPRIVPKALFDPLNATLTRFGARRASRQSLAQTYDKAHRAALDALDSVTDQDLQRSLQYPDWDPLLAGEVTVERLFHYVKAHFDSHAAQIRAAVARPPDG